MELYIVGLDLGMMQDFTALSMLERVLKRTPDRYVSEYNLVHLERFPLGTQYPEIVKHVAVMFQDSRLQNDGALIVDATGVGIPVVQMLIGEGLFPIPVTITGGSETVEVGNGFHVPKRHLVSALVVLFQSGRLKIAQALKEGPTLVNELQSFQYKLDKRTGHDTYESVREEVHDDLVMSVALAAWYATQNEDNDLPESEPWKYDEEQNEWDLLNRL